MTKDNSDSNTPMPTAVARLNSNAVATTTVTTSKSLSVATGTLRPAKRRRSWTRVHLSMRSIPSAISIPAITACGRKAIRGLSTTVTPSVITAIAIGAAALAMPPFRAAWVRTMLPEPGAITNIPARVLPRPSAINCRFASERRMLAPSAAAVASSVSRVDRIAIDIAATIIGRISSPPCGPKSKGMVSSPMKLSEKWSGGGGRVPPRAYPSPNVAKK